MQLRPYQSQAVSDLRLALQTVHSALLVMPTGAGKTVVFTEIARLAREKGKTVFILVHRRELIRQASEKLTKAGVTHGIIAAGFKPSRHWVQVASVQTLVRRFLSVTRQPDLLIIDEGIMPLPAATTKSFNDFQAQKSLVLQLLRSALTVAACLAISTNLFTVQQSNSL